MTIFFEYLHCLRSEINLSEQGDYLMSDEMFNDIFNSFNKLIRANIRDFDDSYYFTKKLKDNGNNYSVKVDVPGFEKEEIDIEIINDSLNIKAKNSENTKNFIFYLPKDIINKEAVSSSLKNGQLTITFPKKTKEQQNTIKVKVV